MSAKRNSPGRGTHLTARESKMLRLISQGVVDKELGAALKLHPATVRVYLCHLYKRLRVRNRAHAAAWYVRHTMKGK